MALKDKIPAILEYIENHKVNIEYNKNIFEILEGDLLSKVRTSLAKQITAPDSYRIAEQRIPPINVLKKINDKLSKLYMSAPTRTTEVPSDADLVAEYEKLGINRTMNDLNYNFNGYKYGSIELYEDDGYVKHRAIPSHQCISYGDDPSNPLKMTVWVKFMGQTEDGSNKYWFYSDEEFISVTDAGEIVHADMVENEGINPFGIIPAVYASRSRFLLTPMPDTDTLRMVILVPILLGEVNFAAQFLSNPIIYGIDVDGENMGYNANTMWLMNSTDEGKKPELGVIRPEVNILAQIQNAAKQLGFWMETRNVRPGSVGSLDTVDKAQSGISLMIQNIDTTEDRKQQANVFKDVEKDMWRRIAQMHNTLAGAGRLKTRGVFTTPENLDVEVVYAEQKIIEDRSTTIKWLNEEVVAGFSSKRRAIKTLNPHMSDEDIDELLEEIALEDALVIKGTIDGSTEEDI